MEPNSTNRWTWQENMRAIREMSTESHERAVKAEREVKELREALHRIHRGDPQPWKIAADALTDAGQS